MGFLICFRSHEITDVCDQARSRVEVPATRLRRVCRPPGSRTQALPPFAGPLLAAWHCKRSPDSATRYLTTRRILSQSHRIKPRSSITWTSDFQLRAKPGCQSLNHFHKQVPVVSKQWPKVTGLPRDILKL